ncbi:MAG: nitroreductase family protein [Christensenellaceae bacterium]|nr:nitroreductase family protein [Christensenellaceae bacterium]
MSIIEERRSIRKFTEQSLDEEQISQLIAKTAYAPSWKNCQPIRYIAVCDAALKQKVAQECVMGFAGNQAIIENCPVLIVETIVHGRSGFERDGSYSTTKEDRWEVFDAGIAAQTLCLAAQEMGLGTVIMGIFDEQKLAETVGIPEGQIAAALIAVGYPDIRPQAPRRKTVEDLLVIR